MLKFFLNSANKAYLRGLAQEFGESTNAIRLELNKLRDEKLKSDLKQELNDSSETPQIIAKNKSEKDAASFMLKILLRFVILLGFLIFLRVLNI